MKLSGENWQGYLMLKLRQNGRALSPIFATLIILAVVTVLFIPVFIWSAGLSSSNTDSWNIAGVTATERITIEALSLKRIDCKIYVRNIGQTTVTIDNVFISLADGTGTIHPYDTVDTDKDSVIQGDLITITIPNLGFDPQPQTAYLVKVFTTRGVGDSYQVVT